MSLMDRICGFFRGCLAIAVLSANAISDLIKSRREIRKIDRRGYIEDLKIDPTPGWDHKLSKKVKK